ncbi:MAG: Gfo/Idh/MocA family oxidoreductase [Alphaproteobacteria bacterium]|nr:Gfo/Idh/MocA family oxidoreductase [Alphaproteobacteria bacterium]
MGPRIGILGVSPGNGHPFSFSAILNGYDDESFARAGWPVIHAYLKRRRPDEFGIAGARVTRAWTQDPATTEALCAACRIEQAVAHPGEMIGQIDAAIVARDDHASHWTLARPFLEAGLPVFVDKPLSTDAGILARFRPYLERGKLMSAAGLRYAAELDDARAALAEYGEIVCLRGAVINGWEAYGIHLVEAMFSVTAARPLAVSCAAGKHERMTLHLDDGSLATIDALGTVPVQFTLAIHGRRRTSSHELGDNFAAFKRMLTAFLGQVGTGRPAIAPQETLCVMRTLIAGRRAAARGGGPVQLAEVTIDG